MKFALVMAVWWFVGPESAVMTYAGVTVLGWIQVTWLDWTCEHY